MPPSPQARDLLADAIAAQGPGYRNTSDSVRAGNWGNIFTASALMAIDEALKMGPNDDAEGD